MPAASFHTASLTTTPVSRKTTLMTALSDMLDTIGFGTQVDAYDITDEGTWQFTSASRASVEASKTGSLVAVVREVVHAAGKTFGTVHYVFFSRVVADAEFGGTEWVTGVETYTPRFILGVCAVVGGWDSVNHKPTSTTFASTFISSSILTFTSCSLTTFISISSISSISFFLLSFYFFLLFLRLLFFFFSSSRFSLIFDVCL
jgi:hypothetical protein